MNQSNDMPAVQPFTTHAPDDIHRSLQSAGTPVDVACGLLVTDPAILFHLMQKAFAELGADSMPRSVRDLAAYWLLPENRNWYHVLGSASQSTWSIEQNEQLRALGKQSTFAAALVGEWSQGVNDSTDFAYAELLAVTGVFPQLLSLHAMSIESLDAFLEHSHVDEETVETAVSPEQLASIALKIAESVGSAEQRISVADLSSWGTSLQKDAAELRADILRVATALDTREVDDEEPGFSADNHQYLNALSTVRNRLSEPEVQFSEQLDHLMYALCHCESMTRTVWYGLNPISGMLETQRAKTAVGVGRPQSIEVLPTSVAALQLLLERPRILHLNDENADTHGCLLPDEGPQILTPACLAASVFCGQTAVGVLYADAVGAEISAADVEKFRAIAQMASRIVSLSACRASSKQTNAPEFELEEQQHAA